MKPRTDAQLIAASLAGSRSAAEALFQRHWPACWRAAYALTGSPVAADDVAQEAFVRAFAALGRFDRNRPFRPWLQRIAINHALDLLRRERARVQLTETAIAVDPTDEIGPDSDLRCALSQLAPERRTVLVLRYVLGYSPPEIASLLDLPDGTVSSRLARALADLRTCLEVENVRR